MAHEVSNLTACFHEAGHAAWEITSSHPAPALDVRLDEGLFEGSSKPQPTTDVDHKIRGYLAGPIAESLYTSPDQTSSERFAQLLKLAMIVGNEIDQAEAARLAATLSMDEQRSDKTVQVLRDAGAQVIERLSEPDPWRRVQAVAQGLAGSATQSLTSDEVSELWNR